MSFSTVVIYLRKGAKGASLQPLKPEALRNAETLSGGTLVLKETALAVETGVHIWTEAPDDPKSKLTHGSLIHLHTHTHAQTAQALRNAETFSGGVEGNCCFCRYQCAYLDGSG